MPRLYCTELLDHGFFELTIEQRHHLVDVLRLRIGDEVSLFNNESGEWAGKISSIGKKTCTVELVKCLRQPESVTPLCLVFAPLKQDPQRFLLEKATELGTTEFWPIITQRTVNQFTFKRAQAHILAATQQCERLDLPELHQLQKLSSFLDSWPSDCLLYVADERGWKRVPPLLEVLSQKQAGFLIGPEGGFAQEELALMESYPFVRLITLGPRILRAETAALMCLSLFQGIITR